MTCQEAEKSIPFFLQDEMDSGELEDFLLHIEECPECKEELTIQLLVTEGLEKLEEGGAFNLQTAFSGRLENAAHRVHVTKKLRRVLFRLEVLLAAEMILALLFVLY